jgi:hypothetical protein
MKVKLTEEGIKLVKLFYSDKVKITIDEDGYWAIQVHKFINIFGKYMVFGVEKYLDINFLITEKGK